MFKKYLFTIIMFAVPFMVNAETYNALGEAVIEHNDIANAKNIAISRAKWAAIEQASSISVKIDTIMNNAQLADEAVKMELSATIKSFEITDEGKDGDTYWVSIKADIVPDKANDTLNNLAKNTSIVVLIPAYTADGKANLNNSFTSSLSKQLQEKGFEVIAINKDDQKIIETAIANNDLDALSTVFSSNMATSLLFGSLKIIEKSGNIGYGNVNFALVNGELEWQLISKVDGKNVVVNSGTQSARGQGSTPSDASYYTFNTMAKRNAPRVVSEVSQAILGDNAKTIRVALKGNSNMQLFRQFREDVKKVPFVLDIKEQGVDALLVDYPEKTYYLASFLERNFKYKVFKILDDEIIVEIQ